ncbi:MAG TPA: hypothetical protein VL972_06285 [Solirubrobacteraceae bacterium]|nr:hypothetical protein [Solirubrobacteraceae bacterium]
MVLGLATAALVLAALLWELNRERAASAWRTLRACAAAIGRDGGEEASRWRYDPGRERRAETKARALLRSCVNEEEWAMYRDLGFLRVWGGAGAGAEAGAETETERRYAYLIYPHKPLLAYVPETGALLSEYCVAFPDRSRPYGSVRLPDSDDVLAKWMALGADERRLVADANVHLPGRQLDPERVARDLERLAAWEAARETSAQAAARARTRAPARAGHLAGSVRAA